MIPKIECFVCKKEFDDHLSRRIHQFSCKANIIPKFEIDQEVHPVIATDPDGELMYVGECEIIAIREIKGRNYYIAKDVCSLGYDIYEESELFLTEKAAIKFAESGNGL